MLQSLIVVALLPLVGVAAWGPAIPQRLGLVAVGLVATLAGAHLVGHRTLRGRFDRVREPEPPDGFGSPSG